MLVVGLGNESEVCANTNDRWMLSYRSQSNVHMNAYDNALRAAEQLFFGVKPDAKVNTYSRPAAFGKVNVGQEAGPPDCEPGLSKAFGFMVESLFITRLSFWVTQVRRAQWIDPKWENKYFSFSVQGACKNTKMEYLIDKMVNDLG